MKIRTIHDVLHNMEAANTYIENIEDPIVKLLVDTARHKAIQGVINFSDASDDEFEKHMPTASFDMLFYCKTIARLFSNKYFISEILKGNLDIADQI